MPATLPKTKTYRVATLAVRYAQPRLTLGPTARTWSSTRRRSAGSARPSS
jgi:hypothetical protein